MTLAHTIANYGKPTLVLSHNKTLAAQLYGELRQFLPAERGRVLRLLLRLLPARSVRPLHRRVHREGRVDQSGHREPPAAGHVEPDGAGGRRHRRHGQRHLRLGRSRRVSEADGDRSPGRAAGAGTRFSRSWCGFSTAGTTSSFEQGTFRVRGDSIEIFPAYAEQAIRIELWGDEVERISKINPLTGETIAQLGPVRHLSGQALRHPAAHHRASGEGHPRGAGRPAGRAEGGRQAAGGATARIPYQLRYRDAAGGGHLRRHRELLPASHRPPGGRAAGLPDRLLPARFSGGGGRVAREPAPDRRHVQRRPGPQADPGGVRLPAALGAGQPAAPIRRVHGAGAADDQPLGYAGRPRAAACLRAWSWSRSSGRPG